MKPAPSSPARSYVSEATAAAPVAPLRIPLVRPNPPRLSRQQAPLAALEASGVFSNYGPVNTRLESGVARSIFASENCCVTVANATLGLMLAIRQAVGLRPRGRYALMPSFTFAAAAQAAIWCGLTPLLCDIDAKTWLPDPDAENELLTRYGDEVAVIVPNATFGNLLDLQRYQRIAKMRGIPLVVDAAAALGSLDMAGKPFGLGSPYPLVFSMHATKAFATAEGGMVYCENRALIETLRAMGNFGFGSPRSATGPGLNAKMSEVCALLALLKLDEFDRVAERRQTLFDHYRALLPDFTFQALTGRRVAHQFVSVLVPENCRGRVPEIIATLRQRGIGAGQYFVPHLAEQPFFRETCVAGPLPATEAIGARIVSLPMYDSLSEEDIAEVCEAFRHICERRTRPARALRRRIPRAKVTQDSPVEQCL